MLLAYYMCLKPVYMCLKPVFNMLFEFEPVFVYCCDMIGCFDVLCFDWLICLNLIGLLRAFHLYVSRGTELVWGRHNFSFRQPTRANPYRSVKL